MSWSRDLDDAIHYRRRGGGAEQSVQRFLGKECKTEHSYTVYSRYQGKRKTVVIYSTSQLPYSSRFEVLVKTTGSRPLWTGLFEIAGVYCNSQLG